MQHLSQIKSLLAAYNLHPRHRLGQNFLIDSAKLDAIVQAAQIEPGEVVLEVGPGTGVLTSRLLQAGARVLAVEIDQQLEPMLREQFAAQGDCFQLIIADVLAGKHEINPVVVEALSVMCDGDEQKESGRDQGRGFKLIANLPYQVASPLLINLALDHPSMRLGLVMVQKEVADRLTAEPGGKEYGAMSVLVQAMCEVTMVLTLPPGCFWPQPKVTSAVVRVQRRERALTDDPQTLAKLTQRLFSQRRKQLGTILGRDRTWPAGVTADLRPEQVNVTQMIELSRGEW